MKKLVFDSSSLISLSEKCFVNVLGKLAEQKNIEFFIPKHVLEETVNNPIKIKKFGLNAIRIRTAINNGWIKVAKQKNTEKLAQKIAEITTNICYAQNTPMEIIHRGEIEALALTKTLQADALIIDERTTRMLIEEPQNLLKLLEFRTGKKIKFDQRKVFEVQKIAGRMGILRSSEIIAIAYEKNCFVNELEHTKASLKAALFSVKYAGCAVTEKEIEEYLKGIR